MTKPDDQMKKLLKVQAEILKAIRKDISIDVAFSDDVHTCKNCGHKYTGERLCPECGA